ncbi:sodium ion-translocating decarboxylase subunit beta [Flammeovirga aprica]|nr:sodium ion-translocating decarboxylase subunit beta [Flammeovirga aprica]
MALIDVQELFFESIHTLANKMEFYETPLPFLLMIGVGALLIILALKYNYEPLFIISIGAGMILGNNPYLPDNQIGINGDGAILNFLYMGIENGIYSSLIFLGFGLMTDFTSLISNPKLILLGSATQIGVFLAFMSALLLGFNLEEASTIGLIGGADGLTAIFLAGKLAPHLLGPVAIAAYSYMALVPVILPSLMRFMTTKEERCIIMKPEREVSRSEKILFPLVGLLFSNLIAPHSMALLGLFFFGNILNVSGKIEKVTTKIKTSLVDIITVILGLTVGLSTQANEFFTLFSVKIFLIGIYSFVFATISGLSLAKIMNFLLKGKNRINPLLGASAVPVVPNSANIVQKEAFKENPDNVILSKAIAANVSGLIGSALIAGIFLSFFK